MKSVSGKFLDISSIKVLISIIVVLFVIVYILFNVILENNPKEEKKINQNPSSIQERRDALKKMFN